MDPIDAGVTREVSSEPDDLKKFWELMSLKDDPNDPYSLSSWRSAWEQMSQSVLNRAFVKARNELMTDQYISSESEVRLPYSLDDRCYPVLLTHMVEAFSLSPYFHLMSGFGRDSATRIVEEYLQTPPTYIPKNE